MYTLFTQKTKDETIPFQVTEALEEYMDFLANKSINPIPINIVLFQGYLGSKPVNSNPNPNQSPQPYAVLASLFSGRQINNLIITRGMGQPVNRSKLNGLPISTVIDLSTKTKKDHRKMVFFFDVFDDKATAPLRNSPLRDKDVEKFISSIKVHAVLIGSSNVSFETYYNSPANKGEADLFLFTDGLGFGEYLESEFSKQSEQSEQSEENVWSESSAILSKSIHIGSVQEYDQLVPSNPHQLSVDEKYLTLILYNSLVKNIV
ncbi:TPA: hypothetical protein ACGO0I_000676 [Streptococcus suis]